MRFLPVRKLMRFGAIVGMVGVAAGALAACGGGSSSSSSSESVTQSTTGESGSTAESGSNSSYTIAMIGPLAAADDFTFAQKCGAELEAQNLGVDLAWQAPTNYSAPEQINTLRSVMATNPDALVVEPDDSAALQVPLEAAAAQGIPVVILDTLTTEPEAFTAAITTNDAQAGERGAEALIQLSGDEGSAFAFGQSTGFATTNARIKGFEAGLEGSGMTNAGPQYTEGDVGKAASIMTAALARDPELAGVFDTGGTAYEGVASVLQRAGKTGQVKLVAMDTDTGRIELMEKDVIQALIGQDIKHEGELGVRLATEALNGKEVPKLTTLPTKVVTMENLHSPSVKPFLYDHTCTAS